MALEGIGRATYDIDVAIFEDICSLLKLIFEVLLIWIQWSHHHQNVIYFVNLFLIVEVWNACSADTRAGGWGLAFTQLFENMVIVLFEPVILQVFIFK